MTSKSIKVALGATLSILGVLFLSGCGGPHAAPISQRKPGTDMAPTARADKRGDNPTPGMK